MKERIKRLRLAAGLTQKQLGSMIGVSESTISQYESGAKSPMAETLMRLSEALSVSMDYIAKGEETALEEYLQSYIPALRDSPERRRLLDLSFGMKRSDLQKFVRMMEAWAEKCE